MNKPINDLRVDVKQQQALFAAALSKAEAIPFEPDFLREDGSFATFFFMWLAVAPLEVGKLYHMTVPLKPEQPMLVVKHAEAAIGIIEGFSGLTSESLGFNLIGTPTMLKKLKQSTAWPNAATLQALIG